MKNYLNVAVIVLCGLLTACASTPPPQSQSALTNEQVAEYIKFKELEKSQQKLTGDYCADAAKYARTLSFLFNAGIPLSTLEEYTINPTVVNFPTRTIQFFVINHKGHPGQVYDEVIDMCQKEGWVELAENLRKAGPPPIDSLKLTHTLSKVPSVNSKKKR